MVGHRQLPRHSWRRGCACLRKGRILLRCSVSGHVARHHRRASTSYLSQERLSWDGRPQPLPILLLYTHSTSSFAMLSISTDGRTASYSTTGYISFRRKRHIPPREPGRTSPLALRKEYWNHGSCRSDVIAPLQFLIASFFGCCLTGKTATTPADCKEQRITH
jgi:hypothetical protein